jgi:hypothetical protein
LGRARESIQGFAHQSGTEHEAMGKIARNWIHIRPGSPAFVISNNACDYFELGERDGGDFWLEGRVDGAGEFVFDGRVFAQASDEAVTLENFPKGKAPAGCTMQPLAEGEGFEIVRDGVVLFGFEVLKGKLCRVISNIHAADGALVAEARDDRFELYRGPALIGRSAQSRAQAA